MSRRVGKLHLPSLNTSSRPKCKMCACGRGENMGFVRCECGPFLDRKIEIGERPSKSSVYYPRGTTNVSARIFQRL